MKISIALFLAFLSLAIAQDIDPVNSEIKLPSVSEKIPIGVTEIFRFPSVTDVANVVKTHDTDLSSILTGISGEARDVVEPVVSKLTKKDTDTVVPRPHNIRRQAFNITKRKIDTEGETIDTDLPSVVHIDDKRRVFRHSNITTRPNKVKPSANVSVHHTVDTVVNKAVATRDIVEPIETSFTDTDVVKTRDTNVPIVTGSTKRDANVSSHDTVVPVVVRDTQVVNETVTTRDIVEPIVTSFTDTEVDKSRDTDVPIVTGSTKRDANESLHDTVVPVIVRDTKDGVLDVVEPIVVNQRDTNPVLIPDQVIREIRRDRPKIDRETVEEGPITDILF